MGNLTKKISLFEALVCAAVAEMDGASDGQVPYQEADMNPSRG